MSKLVIQIPHILRLEVYELNLNGLCSPTSEHFSQLKTVYSNEARNKAPTKAELGAFFTATCVKRREN